MGLILVLGTGAAASHSPESVSMEGDAGSAISVGTETRQDDLPSIAAAPDGSMWVVWSQQLEGNWDLFARRFDPTASEWGALVRLGSDPLPDINPRLWSDGRGDAASAPRSTRPPLTTTARSSRSALPSWSAGLRAKRLIAAPKYVRVLAVPPASDVGLFRLRLIPVYPEEAEAVIDDYVYTGKPLN